MPGFDFNLVAIDDHSEDPTTLRIIGDYYDEASNYGMIYPVMGEETPDERIGIARQFAVTLFMESDCYYLLLLDSDIIITRKTIAEAIHDYEALALTDKIGGYTLHPLGHVTEMIQKGAATFATIDLTGDAHMLFRRDHLELVGNHFGPEPHGFADNQIKAIYSAGRKYWTKLNPPHQVQHIGIGDNGSSIYENQKKPMWNLRPYRKCDDSGEVLSVEGFDVQYYMDCVEKVGGDLAPRRYFEVKGVPW